MAEDGSKNGNQDEPSMEEILASIRRIISEEDEEGRGSGGDGAGPAEDGDAGQAGGGGDTAAERRGQPETGNGAEGASAFQNRNDGASEMAEDSENREEDDVLELTDVVDDEEATAEAPGEPETDKTLAAGDQGAGNEADEIVISEENENGEMPVETAGSVANTQGSKNSDEERLVSEAPAALTATAMAALHREIGGAGAQTTPDPTGLGNRTLEAIVRDLLRPLLKDWLDQNLPAIVERLVQAEIRKIARRAEDD
ncbi:MAG: DUF2497 domain-containing protein [Alphaproteobacteria bacterium]